MTTLVSIPSTPFLGGEASLLESNLAALAGRSPRAAEAVRRASPHPGVRFIATEQDGALSAEVDGRALASRRRPLDESDRLAETVDFRSAGAAVVLGFGLGHHVAAIARRGGPGSLVLVFEPDAALLRAVLERVDLSECLRAGRVLVFTDPEDGAAVSASLSGYEAIVALGMTLVEHPASRARLGDASRVFAETITKVVAACRTQVVTTMTQMEVTFRNLLMNADHYAGLSGAGGVHDLAGIGTGLPAVVVSAGPSLERNLHLLGEPGVRDRCIIIAVQTVLKPMLARGIRPHFVTALDYHEISRRFYEGLTAADVEGITLVAEAKANPAILDSFPGMVRLVGAETLDVLLGPGLAGEHGRIAPGATVAHLAYSLARHLGCDPVILIGQDLAFTDGQYYAAGAAIHDVWSTELNPFNTLEMMEWQRIVRWRGNLHIVKDHLGRDVYTDDQMSTYLAQFERDFMHDRGRGLTTVDATEGGARKAHTTAMTLAEALAVHGGSRARAPRIPSPERGRAARGALRGRLESVQRDARTIAERSRQAVDLLRRMQDVKDDDRRLNPLIERVHALRDEVQGLREAYDLVQRLNQAGAFKRFRADRLISLEPSLTDRDRQRRQIERDIVNVTWIAQAADSLDDLLGATIASLDGAPKRTRDPVAAPEQKEVTERGANAAPATGVRCIAVVRVEERSGLGLRRDLMRPIGGVPVLRRTLERLARCKRLERVVLLCHPGFDASALGDLVPEGLRVEHRIESAPTEVPAAVRAARLFAPSCWRGALGGLTCYDEVFDAAAVVRTLEATGGDAALVLGADWCAIDPALADAVIERHGENPAALPFVFTQAPPGLAPCLVSLDLARKLEQGRAAGDPNASLGGMLAYKPTRPRRDPIVDSCCIQIPAGVRGMHERFIADTEAGIRAIERLEAETAGLDGFVAAEVPAHLILELTDARGAGGASIRFDRAAVLVEEYARLNTAGVLTLHGRGDPLLHPDCARIVREARSRGIAAVHVRTRLTADDAVIEALMAEPPDVVSIDLFAGEAATYRALTGDDLMARAVSNIDRLLRARRVIGGMPHPWIVPRLARRDAVYGQVEGVYDRALYFAGAGVIDPPPREATGERIAPLPKPRGAALRDAASRLMIRWDGVVPADESDPGCGHSEPVGSAIEHGVAGVWARLMERRVAAWRSGGHAHRDLRTLY